MSRSQSISTPGWQVGHFSSLVLTLSCSLGIRNMKPDALSLTEEGGTLWTWHHSVGLEPLSHHLWPVFCWARGTEDPPQNIHYWVTSYLSLCLSTLIFSSGFMHQDSPPTLGSNPSRPVSARGFCGPKCRRICWSMWPPIPTMAHSSQCQFVEIHDRSKG